LPSSTIDTFLACSIMIILTLSAMVGTSKIMAPYLNDLSQRDDSERFQELASHILLHTGNPTNWGQIRDTAPNSLGFAAGTSLPYELDIDKISRMNRENVFSLTYPQLWEALGTQDVAFQIEVRTLFDLSVNMISNSSQGNQTTYEFMVTTLKSGMPISANLVGYVALKDFVEKAMPSTNSSGVGSFSVNIPNSLNGTALMVVLARAQVNPQMVSFKTYSFGHNSLPPFPNRTFTRLSPLDYILNASLVYSTAEILKARVFTYDYNFSLTEKAHGVQTREYYIPHLLDSSPTIIVLTGTNGSTSFAEWVAYPQLPLQIGANFNESIAGSKIVSKSHIVTINSALYEVITKWGGQA